MPAIKLCECGCGAPTRPAVSNLTGRGLRAGEPQRFLAGHYRKTRIHREDRGHETPCHIGPWKPERNGYCRIQVGGRRVGAHRWYYEQAYGAIPDGLQIDHLCRQRDCVNAEHLEVVTQDVNMQRASSAKLTPDAVRAMRNLRDKLTQREIGRRFGVHQSIVSEVFSEKRWRGVV